MKDLIILRGLHRLQNEQLTCIETLSSFTEWVDRLRPQKCLFRGLSNREHSIEASAWRRLTNEQDRNNIDKLLEINNGLIRDARDRGHGTKNGRELRDLEILAELQHFRASTFLIDFTYSAQVALWFACQQPFKDPQNPKELLEGKVDVVFLYPDRIIEVTPKLLDEDISFFFETDADGRYPLYYWEPGEINSRIPAQHSVFLFGGDRTIEPDEERIIPADKKRLILDSIQGFSQTTETTLFPDFAGFIQRRTQDRPYVPEGYESYRAAGQRAFQRGDYEEAIPYFDEAINLNPAEANVHYLRGEARYNLHQYPEAISDFNTAIESNESKDDDLNYYRLRGYAKFALSQFNEAKDDLEKALELGAQIENTRLIDSIRSKLHHIDLQTTQGDQWTQEKFRELVPENIRGHYDTRVGHEELYRLGAELQSLIEEKEWKLGCRFGRSYFVFRFDHRRTFGVNLFANPRLAIWGTEADKSKFSEFQDEPIYYPVHRQWVFPRKTTVEELRDILEVIYNEVRAGQTAFF